VIGRLTFFHTVMRGNLFEEGGMKEISNAGLGKGISLFSGVSLWRGGGCGGLSPERDERSI
jgi:hypothetical protein